VYNVPFHCVPYGLFELNFLHGVLLITHYLEAFFALPSNLITLFEKSHVLVPGNGKARVHLILDFFTVPAQGENYEARC
jgi:hypothetical protein